MGNSANNVGERPRYSPLGPSVLIMSFRPVIMTLPDNRQKTKKSRSEISYINRERERERERHTERERATNDEACAASVSVVGSGYSR